MTHPDEGALQALADGELARPERDAAEAHLAACAECAALLARLRHEGARASALLGVGDAAPPMLAALAAFHRRRRAPRVAAAPAAGLRRALPRAAVLVLALAGAAAAAVVPGSPVREWVGAPGVEEREEAPAAPAPDVPAPERARADKAVSIAPADGRVRVAVTGASPELRVRVRVGDEARAQVTATGGAAGARFRTSPGRIEVMGAGPGELVVHLPSGEASAHVEVNGRVVAAKENGVLRALAPAVAGSSGEPVFRAGS
jgi:anti-sigma factor RsiW